MPCSRDKTAEFHPLNNQSSKKKKRQLREDGPYFINRMKGEKEKIETDIEYYSGGSNDLYRDTAGHGGS